MRISRANEIKLILLTMTALVIFFSLITFDANDIRFLTSSPNMAKANWIGFIGAYTAWFLTFLVGFGAYAIPVLIIIWGIMSLGESKEKRSNLRIFGAAFSILAISAILSLTGSEETVHRFGRGGIVGLLFSDVLMKYLGTAGTLIAIIVLFLLSFLITTDFLLFSFAGWIFRLIKALPRTLARVFSGAKSIKVSPVKKWEPVKIRKADPIAVSSLKQESPKSDVIRGAVKKPEGKQEAQQSIPKKKQVVYSTPYKLPGLDLLTSPPPLSEREIQENPEDSSKILEDTLMDFGIEVKVVKVSRGPVITRYELQPASGVRVQKITTLSDNIALAMKAVTIRIVAPIPGKSTVGVEVPNLKRTLVYLREVLEAKEYKKEGSKLKLALGKDISGTPIVADLDKMPHLLIAGATGSGKTVCLNSVITALLCNATPEELKFLMIDPKKVELAPFNDLPHLLAPVVKDSKKASHILSWACNEMDRRYEVFAEAGVRNIDGYNQRSENGQNFEKMPYIVIVIDELHDLMLVAREQVEDMITRIAQLARAVGIHMIIATQRPSVDVITGVIKANLPSRISFKVASKVDSRTVLDMNGAEKLLGRGDMLFIESGNPKPTRAQAALVSDEEIEKVTSFIRAQRKPEFMEEIIKIEQTKAGTSKFDKDEIYEEAVKLVVQTKQASVSMLQRRLGVGYTRAARLIDMMEDEGIVGPYQGSKPRELLAENTE